MKKLVFIFFSTLISIQSFSQVRLGLKFSPLVNSNRVAFSSDTLDVTNNGAALKLSAGLVVDKSLSDTYYFSTGITYFPKQITVEMVSQNAGSAISGKEEYLLQYLQIPASIKLFTNDIQPDLKLYFQLGLTAEIKIHEEAKRQENMLIKKFQLFDSSVLFGVGSELKAGVNTTLFGGISYNRGLLNVVKNTVALNSDLLIRNTILTIDFGIKF